MSFSQTLLPEFDQEMANTRKLLELVPEDKFAYAPHEKSMKLGRLASHIAELPSWAKHTLETEALELEPGQKPFYAGNGKELMEAFDKNVKEARAAIETATDDELSKTWTLKFGEDTLLSMPRTAVLRSVVMNHIIHHRAQLGVYLRLNNIQFPGMYGPSADEMQSWKAKSA
jgi:uncharacterized damage-inducible protein DinB